jgi:hypothetical protein
MLAVESGTPASPLASAVRKSETAAESASSAASPRAARKAPNCNRSERYEESVFRDSPRSSSM